MPTDGTTNEVDKRAHLHKTTECFYLLLLLFESGRQANNFPYQIAMESAKNVWNFRQN